MLLVAHIIVFLLLNNIDVLHSDMASTISLHEKGTDFIPANPRQLLGVHSSISTSFGCSLLCHQDPQCRTFVFDPPTCRLYDGARSTGQVLYSSSNSMAVGEILYDNVDSSASYNQSCDHCYPDRYLVCRNNQCQCPSNTYWNGHGQCVNQQFVDPSSSCVSNDGCRADMNLTCICNQCQCPPQTFWYNQTCVPQYGAGAACNSSNQCRNDLYMVCSRINKTCISPTPQYIKVLNASIPAKFSIYGRLVNKSFGEWFRAFDNNSFTLWNSGGTTGPAYMYLFLDDQYLLTSFQLTAFSNSSRDPRAIEYYFDENGTCLAENISIPAAPSNYYTFSPFSFTYPQKPFVAKQILLSFLRFGNIDVWIPELMLFGIPY